jgi:hypothetical protein
MIALGKVRRKGRGEEAAKLSKCDTNEDTTLFFGDGK